MLYNQEKCSNNWKSIYEVCLLCCDLPKPWRLFCHALDSVWKACVMTRGALSFHFGL